MSVRTSTNGTRRGTAASLKQLDVGVTLLLQVRQFGNTGRHNVFLENIEQVFVVVDLPAAQGVGADVEVNVLRLQGSNGTLQLVVLFGAGQQTKAIAV